MVYLDSEFVIVQMGCDGGLLMGRIDFLISSNVF